MKLKWHLIALIALILCLVGVSTTPVHAAGDDSLAKVKAKGTLVMGNSPNYPPYEFTVNKMAKRKSSGWISN